MKKLKSRIAWATVLFMMVGGLASCQSEDIVSQAGNSAVAMEAVAHVSMGKDTDTRASLTPDNEGLKFAWDKGDRIVVISEDGTRNIGVMTLSGEGGQPYGNFEGILNVEPDDNKVNVYYLGRNKTEGLEKLSYTTDINMASQNTDVESITDYAIMHALTDLTRENGKVSMNFMLKSIISYARFCFHLPEGITATDEVVTVKGKNIYNACTLNFADASLADKSEGAISIVPNWSTGDASMIFVPATGAETEFEVTIGEVTYKASLETKDYVKDINYCGNQPLHGRDIYFTEGGEWTLVYDANGGSGAPEAATRTDIFTPSYQFTVSTTKPVNKGYKFLGWADDANATEAQYQGEDIVTLTRPETSKTIYAVWQRGYTLYYKASENGKVYYTETQYAGPGSTSPWIFYTQNYTDEYPTKDGYTFLGWADTENATEVQYNKTEATIDLTKDVFEKTVYPVWKKNGTEGNITAPGSKGTDY